MEKPELGFSVSYFYFRLGFRTLDCRLLFNSRRSSEASIALFADAILFTFRMSIRELQYGHVRVFWSSGASNNPPQLGQVMINVTRILFFFSENFFHTQVDNS